MRTTRSGARSLFGALLALGLLALSYNASAQGLEGVIVETYARGVDGLPPGTNTYRIYMDLAPDHELQVVYGDSLHPLHISTSTTFFNDTLVGRRTADRIDATRLHERLAVYDSWVTIGAASDAHWGVPRTEDTDGSVLDGAWAGAKSGLSHTVVSDGLIGGTVPEVVLFNLDLPVLQKTAGATLATNNGAWAVLGGVRGPTPENRVLIGQFTTDGTFTFALNVQIEAPDHITQRYVWGPAGEKEEQFPALSQEP